VTPDSGPVLLAISRAAIARTLGAQAEAREDAHWLADPGATFVTLKKKGELRGCIGSLEARRPLLQDVKSNAVAAAFRDPRFPPVAWGELDELTVEVSLLSPMSSIEFASEEDAITQLRPFEDGVVLVHSGTRTTFLPQVWEDLPHPAEFLRQLKRKAGLPADFWVGDLRLFRYSVWKWSETAPSRSNFS
jgi:AmmeMemoRadiSam system protein A